MIHACAANDRQNKNIRPKVLIPFIKVVVSRKYINILFCLILFQTNDPWLHKNNITYIVGMNIPHKITQSTFFSKYYTEDSGNQTTVIWLFTLSSKLDIKHLYVDCWDVDYQNKIYCLDSQNLMESISSQVLNLCIRILYFL